MNLSHELQQRLHAQATRLRIGQEVEALVALPELMSEVVQQVQQTEPSATEALAALMAQSLAQWQRQDWIGLADTLEYEFMSSP